MKGVGFGGERVDGTFLEDYFGGSYGLRVGGH